MIGHLHLLWWWCLDYAPDGDLRSFSPDDLEYAMGWEGEAGALFDALVCCGGANAGGFIDVTEDGMWIHDWDMYGGKLIARREEARHRKALSRGGPAAVTRMSHGCHTDILVEESREEESTEEEKRGEGAESTRTGRTTLSRAFPDGFLLRDADMQWAEEMAFSGSTIEKETFTFVDYYRGRGDARADWYATWRTWMRRARLK